MRSLSLLTAALCVALGIVVSNHQFIGGNNALLKPANLDAPSSTATEAGIGTATSAQATFRYRLDAPQSKFIAHAKAGGLLWFKGHDHLIAVREFTGEARFTPDSMTQASLEITAKTVSFVETSSVFTEQQKQIINKELREIVFEPDKYPEIVFRSKAVTGKAIDSSQYDLKITGDLTLHGVTRQITIPAQVTVTERELKARGEFSINRSDFKVKATSAVHGLVRVRDKVRFTFDIAGHKL